MRVAKLAAIALMASEIQGFLMTNRSCQDCLNAGQRACLGELSMEYQTDNVDYTKYTCCTANSFDKDCWVKQVNSKYCTTKITAAKKSFVPLKNQDLREWTCPIDADKCDTNVDIPISSDTEYVMRSKQWDFEVPTAAASNWNCKYKVSLDKASTLSKTTGFLMV